MKLPETYLEKMSLLLKDDMNEYLDAMEKHPFSCIRINTGKISVEEFMRISPFELTPVPWCPEGFYVNENERPGLHPYYYAGLYYIQEPSAMSPAAVLDVREGDIVLDACAAPGGKSTALACRMNHKGLLVSNDISVSRQYATLKNMERFGIEHSCIIAEDLNALAAKYPLFFDKILLDAPCSGEGMFRKDPSLITSWLNQDDTYYAPIQKELILNAWKMLKPGGTMVYSTCTFSVKEDEEVIAYLMENTDDAVLEESPLAHHFEPGVLKGFEKCMRLYPHKLNGEGHFVSLLRKKGTSVQNNTQNKIRSVRHEGFEEFMKLIHKDSKHSYQIIKDRIYQLPDVPFDTSSIRTVLSGLYMGSVKKDRFEPSQHLAQSLKADEFDNVLKLKSDDIRCEKFLRGETIMDDECRNGWVLVCVDDYPLGFGKCSSHTIKNKLEKGFRKI
ncbi:MAG: RsmB/NOP family class I SAM-dependent RNA methyltransferase [Erysipelotrichaceae bacterium]|nr:RsmB/NOP family class I SAM-dependent RNA methyltransferase [Erysipelotrichaceae bacterium]